MQGEPPGNTLGVDEQLAKRRVARLWTVHLSGTRVAEWLGIHSYNGEATSTTSRGRHAMVDRWRDRTTQRAARSGRCEPAYLQRGKQLEPLAIDAYCALFDIPRAEMKKPPLREHATHPCVSASPDGMRGDGLLEIKTISSLDTDPNQVVTMRPHWLLQVHTHLECFPECRFCDLVVYTEKHLHLFRVFRDHASFHPADPDGATSGAKRDQDGTALPCTLWEIVVGEYEKYCRPSMLADGTALRYESMTSHAVERVRRALAAYGRRGVAQLAVVPSTPHSAVRLTWKLGDEDRSSPDAFSHIDRIANPLYVSPGGGRIAFAQRLLVVRWHNADRRGFYSQLHDEAQPPPGGGMICHQYYDLVDQGQPITGPLRSLGVEHGMVVDPRPFQM